VASLKDLRRKIASVKNTQQITKAMKMVAASRLRRAQDAISSARPFTEKLEELTGRIVGELRLGAGNISDEKLEGFLKALHPLLSDGAMVQDPKEQEVAKRKIGLLVVTSDKGLCGAYNTNALKNAWKEYSEMSVLPGVEVVPYFVGRKGQEFFAKRGVTGHVFKEFWTGRFTTAKTDKVAKEFTEKFLSGELQEIYVSYMQFRSVISQIPSTKKVLPLKVEAVVAASTNLDAAIKNNEKVVHKFIYEPGKIEILAELLPSLVRTQFYRIFADSLASEFGARMSAMDNATRNAGELISKLTLEANRVRQASITKELMEIVGGAEALKG
jgi:F-type H+-transporting ATPase subunit gamma